MSFGVLARPRAIRLVVGSAAAVAIATSMSACSPVSTPQSIAKNNLFAHGWGTQAEFDCLNNLWTRESGWRVNAYNPSSGAYGIPQALPGSKMGDHGADWATSAETQIKWGLDYIGAQYGSPCGAWNHSLSAGWY